MQNLKGCMKVVVMTIVNSLDISSTFIYIVSTIVIIVGAGTTN